VTSSVTEALDRAFGLVSAILEEVGPDDHDRPTPCAAWDLGALIAHVRGTTAAFATVLEGGPTPARAVAPVADDLAGALRVDAARVVAGWRRPGAMDRDYDAVIELDDGVLIPPIPLPRSMLAAINLLDVGVHVHDLARAIGRPDLAEDDAVATATLDAAHTILAPGIRELVGFGPERPVDPGASATEALLAFTGR
jgi:uncharacterized protein (TIGR03086 family)